MKAAILFLVLFACTSCAQATPAPNSEITNFDQCVEAGYRVMRSMPARCALPDGRTFSDQRSNIVTPKAGSRLCLDKCGDGDCQEIVCMGEGCPCAESAVSCPIDCK